MCIHSIYFLITSHLRPMAYVDICLESSGGRAVSQTGSDGRFELEGVSNMYGFRAEKPGYFMSNQKSYQLLERLEREHRISKRDTSLVNVITMSKSGGLTWLNTIRQTDRYFIDRNKSHYRLICHSNTRDICTCIYNNVSLLNAVRWVNLVKCCQVG